MIPARKNAAFNFLLRRWLERVLRRRFHNVYVGGGEHLRALDSAQPVVGCVNHTNWWDGFILYVLSHRLLPHDIHLAMEEKNLRRYRFFTWMGVFGVDLADARKALPGLRYAVRLLGGGLLQRQGGAPLVWMFVQGELVGAHRPISVKPGAMFLARRADAVLLPLVLRYEWLQESRPSVFVEVGEPLPPGTTEDRLRDALHTLLARTTRALDTLDLDGYEPLFRPGVSMNKRWDWFVHLVLRRPTDFDKQNR